MEWKIINREGYGAQFNRLWINNNLIKKEAFTDYGKKKIKHELAFLNYIRKKNIVFPIPQILYFDEFSYTMIYYKYDTLSKKWPSLTSFQRKNILEKIKYYLNSLHESEHIKISESSYRQLLMTELLQKTIERVKEIEPLLKKYSHVKKVNNHKFIPFEMIIDYFEKKMEEFINKKEYILCPIHGDCQFNNILIGPQEEILFIDPRGYYGSYDIYGIPEYDDSKIAFALSGYDIFDSMKITSLKIEDDVVFVDDLRIQNLEENSFISVLVLSIWLGNAHCFKDESKAFYSYSYAMWLVSLYLEKDESFLLK